MTAPLTRPRSGHDTGPRTQNRGRDLAVAGAALAFFAVVALVGDAVERADGTLHVPWPPLLATWMPHVGPGTPAALVVAAAVVVQGPSLARRLPWRGLLWGAWGSAMAWTWSLALIDGWQRGVAGRLATRHEYLRAVPRFHDILPTLATFTEHIVGGRPGYWPAHVAGHPPAAVLTFVLLDHLGLHGGGWAGAFVITVGSSVAAAALVALRALAGERTARTAAPFLVLAPAAVWVGTSADGYFAGVAAWAVALCALAATRTVRATRTVAVASGLLCGLAVHLSYGLTLLVLPLAAVLVCARSLRTLPYLAAGAASVTVAAVAAGFRWWDAYPLLVIRYDQGVGGVRPYAYWLFGDLGTVVAAAGLASVAGAGRLLGASWRRDRNLVVLLCAFLLAIVAADVSGMSKAETERIWLPFTLWLPAGAVLLPRPDHRAWLAAQAAVALLINHLLLTYW